jgi:hypothetical protein
MTPFRAAKEIGCQRSPPRQGTRTSTRAAAARCLWETVPSNHLDGYNQLDLLLGEGPSKRQEIWDFGGAQLGAVRVDDFKLQFYQQRFGWPNEKATTDMPSVVNLRTDTLTVAFR